MLYYFHYISFRCIVFTNEESNKVVFVAIWPVYVEAKQLSFAVIVDFILSARMQ